MVVEELVEITEVDDIPLFPRDINSTIEDVNQTLALLEEDLEAGIRNVDLEDVSIPGSIIRPYCCSLLHTT